MPLTPMEIVLAICTILGTLIAIYQYKQSLNDLKEQKETLLATYSTSQKLIVKLINDLKEYTKTNSFDNHLFAQGVTFRGYINYLEDMYEKELSDTFYEKLKSMKSTKSNLQMMQSSLEKQILSFNNSQTYFDTTFRYK